MCIKSSLNITNLPVFVIYYIMEFMVSQVMITTVSFYLYFYIFIHLYSYIFIYLYSYIFIYLYSYVFIHHLYMLKKCVVILLLVLLCTHFYDNVKSQNTSYTDFFITHFHFRIGIGLKKLNILVVKKNMVRSHHHHYQRKQINHHHWEVVV